MKPSERKQARHYVVQALYQWQLADTPLDELQEQFLEEFDFSKTDTDYFTQALTGIVIDTPAIDAQFESYLDRALKDLGPIELAILRLGVYELAHCPDVPYRVAINEGVELAKRFGATDSHKYINGVLDKAAKKLRKAEVR